ncbi:uncharacterized protein C8Q71DRAFT_859438 [Rhodofomes roseus]|uniref:Uncharacterized protein n=1 Tax=Rhodofomes roseus TaxID=34475 RepID=A0ABQ8KAL8_9APHY|nr:uncharacterized protein C8Q71DRAFT_859438 [Rhodofomes roseus]KAH9834439.1 hypothetical protein C8Q71DRAFT_859438 [Rhodofomes roseus]
MALNLQSTPPTSQPLLVSRRLSNQPTHRQITDFVNAYRSLSLISTTTILLPSPIPSSAFIHSYLLRLLPITSTTINIMTYGSQEASTSASSSSYTTLEPLDNATGYTTPEDNETAESNEQLLEADELFFDFAKWEHDSTPEASSSGGESTPSLASTEESSASSGISPLSGSEGLPTHSRPPSPAASSAPSTSASPVRSKRKREASDEGPSTSVRQQAQRAPRITPQAAPTPHERRVYTCGRLKHMDEHLPDYVWQGHSEDWWAHVRSHVGSHEAPASDSGDASWGGSQQRVGWIMMRVRWDREGGGGQWENGPQGQSR